MNSGFLILSDFLNIELPLEAIARNKDYRIKVYAKSLNTDNRRNII